MLGSSDTARRPRLRIDDLIGSGRIITSDQELTVGRAADFVVGGDDEYLHRRLMVLWWSGHSWMVKNIGSKLVLYIEPRDRATFSQMQLGPGGELPLPAGPSVVVFSTTQRTYEIHVDVERLGPAENRVADPVATGAPATVDSFKPTFEQRVLLTELAAPLLKYPALSDSEIPSVREVATRLGWTDKKVHQKIERMRNALLSSGIDLPKPYRVSLARYVYAHQEYVLTDAERRRAVTGSERNL